MSPARRRNRTGVFISYSHVDAQWLRRLRVHLRPLERDYKVTVWDDTKIKTGAAWEKDILEAIDAARVAVLLISADFMASDFIARKELPRLLRAAEREGAVIMPVILGVSSFDRTPSLSRFQSVNPPGEPLLAMTKQRREAVLNKLAGDIESLLLPHKALGDFSAGVNTLNKLADEIVPVMTGRPPAAKRHRMNIEGEATRIVSTWGGKKTQTITAEELKDLPEDRLRHVSALSKAMEAQYRKWEALYQRREDATGSGEIKKLDGELKKAISSMRRNLEGILDFLQFCGIQLDDHYMNVRYLVSKVDDSGAD